MDIQVVLLCTVMCIVLIILPVNCNTCPANCQTCNNDGGIIVEECTSCNDGYWLSGSSCQHCPDNCVTCFNRSSCETCAPEFYSPSSICYSPCPHDCLNGICDDNTGHCLACPPMQYGFVCNLDCDLCKNEQCDQRQCSDGCKPGYWQYQDGEYFECRTCVLRNCASCYTGTICDVCNDGTYLTAGSGTRNYCLFCHPNCETCSSYTSCSTCKSGYFGEACEYTCSGQISECYQCDWDGGPTITCSQCFHSFTLQDNRCESTSHQCPDNCKGCTEDNVCKICKTGWYGELCDQPCHDIPHCVACQETGGSIVCNACNNGYVVIDGECHVTSTTSTTLPPVSSSTTSTPTSTSTATKTSNASPNSADRATQSNTPSSQPQNTSFQTSAFAVGLVTGIGICTCTILVIGLVWFLWRRKRLQKSTTSQRNEPFYENSVTTQELKPTHLHAVIENKSQSMEDNQQVPVGEGSVPSSTDIEQHE